MNLARLNHILIPTTKAERDRWRRARGAFVARALFAAWNAFSHEGRFLGIFWLISGAVSLNIEQSQYFVLWSAITALLAASLWLRRGFRLDGVQLLVRAPSRVFAGQEVVFAVTATNCGSRPHQAIRLSGPFLPWDGRYAGLPPVLRELAPGQTLRSEVLARFEARGEHHLDPFEAHALVPLGLALGRGIESNDVRFKVVPRIARVRALSLSTRPRYQQGGIALASRLGESSEIIGVRPYRRGDPIRTLHAKTSARAGQAMVREHGEEYFTRIAVIVDTALGKGRAAQLEAALSLCAGAVAHLVRSESLVDLIIAGPSNREMTLGRSLGALDQALDLLCVVEPSNAFDAAALGRRLAPLLPRLSAAVFVSLGFDEQREGLRQELTRQGVPCKALAVQSASNAVAPLGPFTFVSCSDIENDKELYL